MTEPLQPSISMPDAVNTSDQPGPLLAINAVTKSFGGLKAVDDLSLELNNGEMRGLIGSNGAGKSTLLHLIYGRIAADSGSVVFDGQDVTRVSARDRARAGMGLVFQVSNIFGELSVVQNLILGAKAPMPNNDTTGSHSVADAVDEMLSTVDLTAHASRRAGELSHGQQQWLEMAMVLLCRPKLLLLDEPTSGMTRAESRQTAELLRRLQQSAVTNAVIVVEHNIEFISLVSDRVTVMHRGKPLADGTIDEVRADPNVQDSYLGRLHDR